MRLLIAVLFALPMICHGAADPKNGKTDARIKTISYHPREVVTLHTHYGYSTHIRFSDGENIELVSIGDAVAWTVRQSGKHLLIQPIEDGAETNMTVLTNKREYNFELNAAEASSSGDKSLTFKVQFRYPEEEMAKEMARIEKRDSVEATQVIPGQRLATKDINLDYDYQGSEEVRPFTVMDDGQFTYFEFRNEIPAIFIVHRDKTEAIVNHHQAGKYTVVKRIAHQFVLRAGSDVTCIYNNKLTPRHGKYELNQVTNIQPTSEVIITRREYDGE